MVVLMGAVVELANVVRRFGRGGPVALDGVSLSIAGGSFVAVMGATGSGKSTLLHCAAGLDRPSSGSVRLDGHDVTSMRERALTQLRRDRVGFVFQSYNLLSELTVAQNVLLPRRLGAHETVPVEQVLAQVGLEGLEGRRVGSLSGGQRQRVALARALVIKPAVIFADEPTGALDPSTGARILGLLRDGVDRFGLTVVMVTHDPVAAAFADRLVLLREGAVVVDMPAAEPAIIASRLREVTPIAPAIEVGV